MANKYNKLPQGQDDGQELLELNRTGKDDASRSIEGATRFCFVPVLDFSSFRIYPYISRYVTFRKGYRRSILSIILIIILCSCVLLQLFMFSAFLIDMIFRTLLFIKIHTGMYPNQTHNSITSLVITTSSNRYYHEFEDWFLFTWDYLYGLIGLYSTVFIFIHSWNNEKEFQGIVSLIKNITQNKNNIRKERSFLARANENENNENQLNNVLKIQDMENQEGEGEKMRATKRFYRFITCSDNRMQNFLDKIGWGVFHLCIIMLSISLIVFWIVVNTIGTYTNTNSTNLLTQDSDFALALSIIDSFHWHLSPVIVCFIIRISCMEITTSLDCLCYVYTSGLVNENRKKVENLSREYYKLISKVKAICKKYRRISAINITVLVFAVVGICLRYIDTSKIQTVDDFIMYDYIDFTRFFTWYLVHFLSVWLMVDAMSTLNLTIDHFPNEILLIFAINKTEINVKTDIKTELELCKINTRKFSIDFFGVVTPSTVHLIIAFGSVTIVIFMTEVIKILLEKIQIN